MWIQDDVICLGLWDLQSFPNLHLLNILILLITLTCASSENDYRRLLYNFKRILKDIESMEKRSFPSLSGHAETQTADCADRADQGYNMALPSLLLRANRKQPNLNVIYA